MNLRSVHLLVLDDARMSYVTPCGFTSLRPSLSMFTTLYPVNVTCRTCHLYVRRQWP